MKIFTITARVTTERTITLAADSMAEATTVDQEILIAEAA